MLKRENLSCFSKSSLGLIIKQNSEKRFHKIQFVFRLVNEEKQENFDEERERMMRFVRFAGFFIVLMVVWYGVGLAEFV